MNSSQLRLRPRITGGAFHQLHPDCLDELHFVSNVLYFHMGHVDYEGLVKKDHPAYK